MAIPRYPDDIPCVEQPHLFFGDVAQRKEAISLCQRCPVTEMCLTDALQRRPSAGVHGGVDFTRNQNEADNILFPKRKPGRPRKSA